MINANNLIIGMILGGIVTLIVGLIILRSDE